MKTAVAATAVALCLAVPGVASAARASLDLEPSDLGPGITRREDRVAAQSEDREQAPVEAEQAVRLGPAGEVHHSSTLVTS